MVGTPAEIGARVAGRDAATQAAYASALPAGDEYSPGAFLANAPGGGASDPYAQIRAHNSKPLRSGHSGMLLLNKQRQQSSLIRSQVSIYLKVTKHHVLQNLK
jgi:hypothetical protein